MAAPVTCHIGSVSQHPARCLPCTALPYSSLRQKELWGHGPDGAHSHNLAALTVRPVTTEHTRTGSSTLYHPGPRHRGSPSWQARRLWAHKPRLLHALRTAGALSRRLAQRRVPSSAAEEARVDPPAALAVAIIPACWGLHFRVQQALYPARARHCQAPKPESPSTRERARCSLIAPVSPALPQSHSLH